MNENPYTVLRKIDWTAEEEDWDPLAAAIAAFDPLMPEELRSLLLDDDSIVRHRGLFIFGSIGKETFVSAEPSQAQVLLQEGLANTSVSSTFALASIQRMAREGRLIAVPEYHGDSYVGQGVVANMARLMRNAARMGVKRVKG